MSDDQTPAEEINEVADAAADELIALRAENQALKDQVLRVAADAENSKRRAEREANDARAFAIQKFGRDLLAVADTLDRALAACADKARWTALQQTAMKQDWSWSNSARHYREIYAELAGN